MMFALKRVLIGVAVLLALPGQGWGDLITFENRIIDRLDLAGPQTEGAFTYRATVGPGWEVQGLFGNPPSALVTFFNGEDALVGDIVEISLSGGGIFTFQSVDFRTILGPGTFSDQVALIGFLGGVQTETLALTTSTTVFQTVPSGFSGPIDLLQVRVTFDGFNAVILDNFNLSPIPEPSALLLGAFGTLGLLGHAWLRRRARRTGADVSPRKSPVPVCATACH